MNDIPREKPVSLNMRVDAKKRSLIDAAVQILGVDRTSFILDAACRKAEDVLLDRRLFVLDDEAFERFEQALDANPLRTNEKLQALLQRPKPWK
ncbi:DUF1778 domain-containing protein [Pseudomonas sp. NPDC007930]|uniref:type II toxin-antitoxin system TacA family antitoxin n=1 Tax=Pseudomonas sp. NPDC007930 TaxID=3364417 RepID=UPI0036E1E499